MPASIYLATSRKVNTFLFSSPFVSDVLVEIKGSMPAFTEGMQKLVSKSSLTYSQIDILSKLLDQNWMLRGKIKRYVEKVIERFYRIHPKPNAYQAYPNPAEKEKRHITQKVAELLGKDTLFLSAPLNMA